MNQNLRDALSYFSLALAIFAIWSTGFFTGWKFWVVTIGMGIFLISAIIETIYSFIN